MSPVQTLASSSHPGFCKRNVHKIVSSVALHYKSSLFAVLKLHIVSDPVDGHGDVGCHAGRHGQTVGCDCDGEGPGRV
jgi:hypothetical protein